MASMRPCACNTPCSSRGHLRPCRHLRPLRHLRPYRPALTMITAHAATLEACAHDQQPKTQACTRLQGDGGEHGAIAVQQGAIVDRVALVLLRQPARTPAEGVDVAVGLFLQQAL